MAEQSEQSEPPAESGETIAAPEAPEAKPKRHARSARETAENPEPPPRHAVILHNDPHNSFGFVIDTLVKILAIDTSRAKFFAETAHRTGKCAVWTGLKEHAEMKAALITGEGPDPFAVMSLGDDAKPLKATVEPVPGT
ncbi:MAG: ATP-dependent Clp protease adaptor ClpS [Planctomycetota bacterium]